MITNAFYTCSQIHFPQIHFFTLKSLFKILKSKCLFSIYTSHQAVTLTVTAQASVHVNDRRAVISATGVPPLTDRIPNSTKCMILKIKITLYLKVNKPTS